jgi:ferredoxin
MCVLIDDTIFQQDDTGLVVIDDDAARTADPALLRHAVSCCPGRALSEVDGAAPRDGSAVPAKSSVTERE